MVRWRRTPAESTEDRPPGMAIKFVHFDDPTAGRELLLALRLAAERAAAWAILRSAALPSAALGAANVEAQRRKLELPFSIVRPRALAAAVALLIGSCAVGRTLLEGSSSASPAPPQARTYAARLVSSQAMIDAVARAREPRPLETPPVPAMPSGPSVAEPERETDHAEARRRAPPASPPTPVIEQDPYAAAPRARPSTDPQPYD